MTDLTTDAEELSLTINGSKLAVGLRPNLEAFEPALRSVALSDSPIFIRAPEEDHDHLLTRLHGLGRRSELPMFRCHSASDVDPLLEILASPAEAGADALGTWALFEVETWPEGQQEKLAELLETLDLARLHGRLRHERIPRVIVFSDRHSASRLDPSLDQRISYFTLVAEQNQPKDK